MKILGTITGVVGSMILIFFKGAEINIWKVPINLLHGNQNSNHVGTTNADSIQKIVGVLCGLGSCFSFSLWLIIHTKMSEEYPCYYSSTALMNLMAAIQTTIFALCVEKDWSQWKLGWSFRLLTAVYSVLKPTLTNSDFLLESRIHACIHVFENVITCREL